MLSIHPLEHLITSRLQCEVEIWTHLIEVEVCIENIASHVMRIGTRESDTIEPVDRVDIFEEFTERGFWGSFLKGAVAIATEDFLSFLYNL